MPLPLRSPTPQVIGFALLSGSCPAAAQKTPGPRPCHTNFVKLSSSCFQFLTLAPAAQGHRWLDPKVFRHKNFYANFAENFVGSSSYKTVLSFSNSCNSCEAVFPGKRVLCPGLKKPQKPY